MRSAPLLVLLALGLSGAAATPASDGLEVRLGNGVFVPDRIEARAGDTILFVNDDGRAHTVTSAWDDGASLNVVLRPGQSVPVVFHEGGDLEIRCVPHSSAHEGGGHEGMVMTLVVAGGASAPAEAPTRWPLFLGATLALGAAATLTFASGTPLLRRLRG